MRAASRSATHRARSAGVDILILALLFLLLACAATDDSAGDSAALSPGRTRLAPRAPASMDFATRQGIRRQRNLAGRQKTRRKRNKLAARTVRTGRLAVITYAGTDLLQQCRLFFKFYTEYHRLSPKDIYVLRARPSIDECLHTYQPNISSLVEPNARAHSFSEEFKANWLQQTQHELLRWYKYVLIADLDEFFLPDPSKHADLLAYTHAINLSHSPFVAAIGYELMPIPDNRLDWSRPVLQQRTKWATLCGMNKPVLTTIPLHYLHGTHSTRDPHFYDYCGRASNRGRSTDRRIDKSLFNIHLKCIDIDAWTDEHFDTDRIKHGNNMSAYMHKRCVRRQSGAILDVPHHLRVF